MAYFADRVKDTTTTTGTGSFTLNNTPPTGFVGFFTAFIAGTRVYYVCEGGTEWEVGMGILSSTNILSRFKIFASSNAGAAVSFSAGTKNIFCSVSSRVMNSRASLAHLYASHLVLI
jgi:hypothetical protein